MSSQACCELLFSTLISWRLQEFSAGVCGLKTIVNGFLIKYILQTSQNNKLFSTLLDRELLWGNYFLSYNVTNIGKQVFCVDGVPSGPASHPVSTSAVPSLGERRRPFLLPGQTSARVSPCPPPAAQALLAHGAAEPHILLAVQLRLCSSHMGQTRWWTQGETKPVLSSGACRDSRKIQKLPFCLQHWFPEPWGAYNQLSC